MNTIFSYWYTGQLRRTDWVCLESWVRNGFDVTLYCHTTQTRVPAGVKLANADEVLDSSYVERLKPFHMAGSPLSNAITAYADIFRMAGMTVGAGLWLDTDVFILQPFAWDQNKPFMCWEGFKRIGASVIYLPKDSAMLAEYLKVLDDIEAIPPWVEFRKSVLRPLKWRLRGQPYRPRDLGITVFGNYAFTMLGRKHYFKKDVLPKNRFYHWVANDTRRFYQDPGGKNDLKRADAWGIHVHRKDMDMQDPVPGSMYHEALKLTSYTV